MCFDVPVSPVRFPRSIGLVMAVLACAAGDVAAQPRPAPDGGRPGGVATVLGGARQAQPQAYEDLEVRIDAVSHEPGAERGAGDPLAHARRALDRARALLRGGNRAGADRAAQIGWAAVELATRRLGRARALDAAREAAVRAARARERARAARESLEAAMAERARLTADGASAPASAPVAGEGVTEATE